MEECGDAVFALGDMDGAMRMLNLDSLTTLSGLMVFFGVLAPLGECRED